VVVPCAWSLPNHLLHEGTKRREEHEVLLYKIIRDLRGSSCLRNKPLMRT
jgi:hypothetical protein